MLDALIRTLDSQGALEVIRHWFKFFGKKIDVAYFKPAHGLNPDVLALYEKNRLVVTSSRLHAVRYKQAFEKYINEQGYTDIGVLVAFSGIVKDPDVPKAEYTEVGMNRGIKERGMPEKFSTDEFKLLLVANKYQTGFDQPLLHTMYVGKRLAGVQAVQALSRLNRTHPGKEDTFVLDFVNAADEIQSSFQPYYE
jgi:type I restriction enzyme R subunit